MLHHDAHQAGETPRYSFVIPLFNEDLVLPILFHRLGKLMDQLDGPSEVILVDDGSSDCSGILAAGKAKDDPRFRYVALSRNFGHQVAITAGMDLARGEATIVMDADLQDPPEVVVDLVAKWREGYDIVYAQRLTRVGESRLKLVTADLFYRLVARLSRVDIPRNVGDFRLIDRKVLEAFRAMPERDRFVRGMFGWMGFRQAAVPYHRLERVAGETKYSMRKMLRLAFDGIVGFSDAPLRLVLWTGFAVSAAAVAYGLYILVLALVDSSLVPGWASLTIILSLLSGVNLIMTGVVGLYVGRIHSEVKGRPLYIIGRTVNVDRPSAQGIRTPSERGEAAA